MKVLTGSAHTNPTDESDHGSGQYTVSKSPASERDYGAFVSTLGPEFLAGACRYLRSLQVRSFTGRKIYNFDKHYLGPFENVCTGLQDFLLKEGISSVGAMSSAHWRTAVPVIVKNTNDRGISSRDITVHYWLLRCLERAGVIPPRWDPRAANPAGEFFLCEVRTRHKYIPYDVEKKSFNIGREFVLRACKVIRGAKESAGVNEKSWRDGYVLPFVALLDRLEFFLSAENRTSTDGMDIPDWERFVSFFGEEICRERISAKTGLPVSDRTKGKSRHRFNNVLAQLCVAGLLPKRFDIPPFEARTKATDGTSRFTTRGWGKTKPEKERLSPFSFRVENFSDRQAPFVFDQFQPLARAFLLDAIPHVNEAFESWGLEKAEDVYQTFTNFLFFLHSMKQQGIYADFFSRLATEAYRTIDDLSWEKIIYEWRDHIQHCTGDDGLQTTLDTRHQLVVRLNYLWKALSQHEIVPPVVVRGFSGAQGKMDHRSIPSLAQLSISQGSPFASEEQEKVTDNLARYFDEHERPEAVEFITALCEQLKPEEVRSLTLDGLTELIKRLNRDRLRTLRRCAEKEFLLWHAHWMEGQRALAGVEFSRDQIRDLLDNQDRSVSERRLNSTRLLGGSSPQGDPESIYLGNCLLVSLAAHDGITSGINGRYHHLKRRYGGIDAFHAYLHPHCIARLALWVIILVDTGVNCEVAREMPFDCLHRVDDPTHMKVSFGLKARANYKRIEEHLPIEPERGQLLSVVKAIQHYQSMSARYRELADDNVKGLLFLDERSGKIIGLTEFRARDDFKCFISGHPELAAINARPSFIRPSYLLQRLHDDPQARIETAQAAADHKSPTTTNVYTGRAHTKLIYQQKIREFQNLFQAVIVQSIEGAAEKLGITQAEAHRLFSEAARSGLGVACLNPKAGIQPGTKRGEDCTRLDACPGCGMRYVVGTVDNIADLILFEEYLKSREEELMTRNLAGWEQRWLPWLLLAEIALAKFKQGETASAFVQAQTKADVRRPTYTPFPLL